MIASHILSELDAQTDLSHPMAMTPVRGGAVNHSFRMNSGKEVFFVKVQALQRNEDENRHRFVMQTQLSGLGLAARPIYLSQHADFQVEEWVDHQSLQVAPLSAEVKCKRLAAALSCIHQVSDIEAPTLNLPFDWRNYIEQAQLADEHPLSQALQSNTQVYLEQQTERTFCHNDLSLSHVTTEHNGCLFDWEYAAWGNRYFDLAGCILVNHLSLAQQQYLCQHYAGLNGIELEHVTGKVNRQLVLAKYTSDLWYLAAQSTRS